MRQEINPAILWTVIAVVVLAVIGIGYKLIGGGGGFQAKTGGSEPAMKKFQETGTFYEPPAGAPIPGRPGAGGNSPMMGMPGMPSGVPSGPPMGQPGGGQR